MKPQFLLISIISISKCLGVDYYVDQFSTTAGDGLSWENPYTNLHMALETATFGDTVHVSTGIYSIYFNNVKKSFVLKRGVNLVGGYLRPNSISYSTTTLDAGNHIGMNVIQADDLSVIRNFTIANSMCRSGSDFKSTSGGGVFIKDPGTVRIENCYFYRNVAQRGACIFGNAVVINSRFEENSAEGGEGPDRALIVGQAYIYGSSFYQNQCTNGNIVATKVTWSSSGGQTVYRYGEGRQVFCINTVFHNNIVKYTVRSDFLYVFGCVHSKNTTPVYPAGMYYWYGSEGIGFFENCSFIDGSAPVSAGTLGHVTAKNNLLKSIPIQHSANPSYVNNSVYIHGAVSEIKDSNFPLGFDNKLGGDQDGVWLVDEAQSIDSGIDVELPLDLYDVDGDGDTSEPISWDAWGNERIQGDAIDIGAFESGNSQLVSVLVDESQFQNGKVIGANNFLKGSLASIYAIPYSGYYFVNWTGDISSTDNPLEVEVDNDIHIQPVFAKAVTREELLQSEAEATELGHSAGVSSVIENPTNYGLSPLEISEPDENSVPYTSNWFYQPDQGWMWTSKDAYPFFYRKQGGEANWLYFWGARDNSNYFYNFLTNEWEEVSTD